MTQEVGRRLVNGEWVTNVADESGGGGSQNLAQVLAEGNDANNLQISNVAEGTLSDDVATVSQLGEGLPTGWTQDAANPATLASNGGNLDMAAGSVDAFSVGVGNILDSPQVRAGVGDPSAGGGVSSHIGSLYLRTNGQAWVKTGAGATDWTQIGGTPAGAIQVVRVPLAFDTAGLVLTGITAYTPAVGDVLLDTSYLSVTEAWDGDTPGIYLYSATDAPGSGDEIIQHYPLAPVNPVPGSSTANALIPTTMGAMYLNGSAGNHVIFNSTAALKLMVDDGASGDPGSAVGAGEFVLIIAPAA